MQHCMHGHWQRGHRMHRLPRYGNWKIGRRTSEVEYVDFFNTITLSLSMHGCNRVNSMWILYRPTYTMHVHYNCMQWKQKSTPIYVYILIREDRYRTQAAFRVSSSDLHKASLITNFLFHSMRPLPCNNIIVVQYCYWTNGIFLFKKKSLTLWNQVWSWNKFGVEIDNKKTIDSGKIAILIALDTSAAFDTLDHTTILHRLQYTFGLSIWLCHIFWICSYMTNRTSLLKIKIDSSSSKLIRHPHPAHDIHSCIPRLCLWPTSRCDFHIACRHCRVVHGSDGPAGRVWSGRDFDGFWRVGSALWKVLFFTDYFWVPESMWIFEYRIWIMFFSTIFNWYNKRTECEPSLFVAAEWRCGSQCRQCEMQHSEHVGQHNGTPHDDGALSAQRNR